MNKELSISFRRRKQNDAQQFEQSLSKDLLKNIKQKKSKNYENIKTILATLFFVVICVSCSKDDEGSEVTEQKNLTRIYRNMALTEVLSSGGFTVVTDYFFQFKANGRLTIGLAHQAIL
jgi:hypothetical protein